MLIFVSDDTKFGQRMLEKMGWKKGEGLGTHSQGIRENIKLNLKLDSKGIQFQENSLGFCTASFYGNSCVHVLFRTRL